MDRSRTCVELPCPTAGSHPNTTSRRLTAGPAPWICHGHAQETPEESIRVPHCDQAAAEAQSGGPHRAARAAGDDELVAGPVGHRTSGGLHMPGLHFGSRRVRHTHSTDADLPECTDIVRGAGRGDVGPIQRRGKWSRGDGRLALAVRSAGAEQPARRGGDLVSRLQRALRGQLGQLQQHHHAGL